MSEQHEIDGALEARVAELEQQLAALQDRRPAARSRVSRRWVAAFGVMLALLAVPGVVLADHRFTDVPPGGFHDDIDWLADYGIAQGYDDNTFRPANAVTRQAMAAFLHRLSNEFEMVSTRVDPAEAANTFTSSASCPGDKRAIAGGGITSIVNLVMAESYPGWNLATGAKAWFVRWVTHDSTAVNPTSITVYALCAPRSAF